MKIYPWMTSGLMANLPTRTEGLTSIEAEGAEGGGGSDEDEPAADDADGHDDAPEGDEADPEEDDEEGEEQAASGEDNPKPKAKETAAQRRARLAKDKDVASLVKSAAAKAVREALAASEAEAKKKAEREKLEGEERLKAEMADIQAERDAAMAERDALKADLAFREVMASTGLVLLDHEDIDYVNRLAAKAMKKDDDLTLEDALAEVAESKPHLFKASAVVDADDAATKKAAKKAAAEKATTSAAPKGKGTEQTSPKKSEDGAKKTRDMPAKEFAKMLAEKHGVRLPH